ncbi:hypothetical protein F5146DRAFT_1206263 [Armillaria mellea]|nr:hypothetical protein F5146DRAFT_1206263 [Armillaria mellea]
MYSATVIVPSLGTTIGAAYVGAMLSSLLFGITVLQVLVYYRDYPNDWQLYRYSVGILWILDAFHLSLTIHLMYHYTVDSFGDYAALGDVVWSVLVSILTSGAIPHIFLISRSFKSICSAAMEMWVTFVDLHVPADSNHVVGHHFHRFLPCTVIFVVTGGFAVGVLVVYKTYCITTFTGLASMDWVIETAFATATGIDFLISFAICYYLHKSRSVSEFTSSTNSRLLVLMWFVLISGLATSTCSTIVLITFIVLPNTLVFLGVKFLLTKLYINSLLSMLNAQNRLQGANSGCGAALSGPTSFSNTIWLTPTGGDTSTRFVKHDGFNIPLSEISSSGPS